MPAVTPPQPVLTIVEGTSFCRSGYDGDIDVLRHEGLFVLDTRILSLWRLKVDGAALEPLSALASEPYHGAFIGLTAPRPGNPEGTVIVERRRFVARGMREDLLVSNYGIEPATVELVLDVDADFADLFEVKDGRTRVGRDVAHESALGEMRFELNGGSRGVRVLAPGADCSGRAITYQAVVGPGETWTTTISVIASVDGVEIADAFPPDRPLAHATPAQRLRGWRETAPRIYVDNVVLHAALAQSERDLGSLRIEDPEHPDDDVVAAGAPWFLALFGRDSLLTSYFMLPYVPRLAFGTLNALARLQGRVSDLRTEEQPGKILHEVRLGADRSLALGGDSVYYGSVDSTPLFVRLCGRALRWGADVERLTELRPAIERALEWIVDWGDLDGDGFVEYERTSDRGLLNQGWKDSLDSMSFSSGELAEAPIALAEVQGYCFAAFEAAAQLSAGSIMDRPRRRAEATLPRGVLDARARLLRDGSRSRQAAARRRLVEHRALPLDGDRRRVGRGSGRRSPDRTRHVHRIRHPHPVLDSTPVQPGQLPQRLGVAPRHDDRRGRDGGRRPSRCRGTRHERAAGRARGVRRPAARVVLRIRPRRPPSPGAVPDLVLAAGLGRRSAVRAAAPVARPAPRPAHRHGTRRRGARLLRLRRGRRVACRRELDRGAGGRHRGDDRGTAAALGFPSSSSCPYYGGHDGRLPDDRHAHPA
jgi:hypothetical protein